MMMQTKKVQGVFSWVVILSECSHVFCCVLPTMFSVLTLLVGMGMMGGLPIWMQNAHEVLHAWEIPMIAFSGMVLLVGWGLQILSKRMDCHDTGCGHGACAPKKDRSELVLKIATILFLVNITVYGVFHRDIGGFFHGANLPMIGQHDDHSHEHHH